MCVHVYFVILLCIVGGMVICLDRGADLHIAHLMPLPLTFSCFIKFQIGFTFLVPAYRVVPEKGPLNGYACMLFHDINMYGLIFVIILSVIKWKFSHSFCVADVLTFIMLYYLLNLIYSSRLWLVLN